MILNWLAMIIAIGSILVGNELEGGHLSSLIQPTAALIVLGGTLGAVMAASTMAEFTQAIKEMKTLFVKDDNPDFKGLVEQLIELAGAARKEGLVALDGKIGSIENQFLAKNLRYVVDGYDPGIVKEMMEEKIFHKQEEIIGVSGVWTDAGGFAPTVGILGVVLGLIHVMSNLDDSSSLGAGIAVAFVATIYGVGAANLAFLPLAKKVKKNGTEKVMEMSLIQIAVLGIQNGLNPRIIEDQLYNFLGDHVERPDDGAQAKAA